MYAHPAAVQLTVVTHEMPNNRADWAGLGSVWMDHDEPFHFSAKPSEYPLGGGAPVPTASQLLDDVHDKDARDPPPLGVGELWTVQVVPFHTNTSVPVVVPPTAVHDVVEKQTSLYSELLVFGLGVD